MENPKTLNTGWLQVLAKKVVLNSHDGDVVVVDEGRVIRLRRGQYGGWLLWEKGGPEVYQGLWVYKATKKRLPKKEAEKVKDVLERVKKVTEPLGVRTEPTVNIITYRYRFVTAKKVKSTDRYSVYEIAPASGEASAKAVQVAFPYTERVGKRGRCNDVCRSFDKLVKLLEAEFRDGEVAGTGVVVPYDTAELERAVAKLLGVDEAEEAAAENAGGGEQSGKEEAGENGGPTHYIVAVLPNGIDQDAAVDAVREALRRLGVANPVVKVVEAEV
jgi:hypothetical protein